MNLFCFGIGYTVGHYLAHGREVSRAQGTVRGAEKVAALRQAGVEAFGFDGPQVDPAVLPALAQADLLLVSAQPDALGDPVLARFEEAIAAAPRLTHIAYLSTIGVYGDHAGAWVDETTAPAPQNERGRVRVAAEAAWLALGARTGRTVVVLRLAGIYGPGRNALADLAAGDARRIDKPGQVFNRIHVGDIGQAIDAALTRAGPSRIVNVTDDEPAPAPDVVAFAAGLMGRAPPPLLPFADAQLSPMARSFYAASRRVSNEVLRQDLRVALAYPTYREGLRALWATGEGRT